MFVPRKRTEKETKILWVFHGFSFKRKQENDESAMIIRLYIHRENKTCFYSNWNILSVFEKI